MIKIKYYSTNLFYNILKINKSLIANDCGRVKKIKSYSEKREAAWYSPG